MKSFKFAALLVSVAAIGLLGHSSASAQTITVDAGNYTFSSNYYYFGPSSGVSLSQTDDTFTFSNLDYLAFTKGTATGEGRASFFDWAYGAVTISAKSGYQIDSVVTGSQGQFSGAFGSAGGSTYMMSTTRTDWTAESVPLPVVLVPTGYFERSNASWAMPIEGGFGAPAGTGSFNTVSPYRFAAGTTNIVGDVLFLGDVRAQYKGTTASLSIDSVSFAVSVSAVPEPETYALMLTGFGLVGVFARRRTEKAKTV